MILRSMHHNEHATQRLQLLMVGHDREGALMIRGQVKLADGSDRRVWLKLDRQERNQVKAAIEAAERQE